MRADRALTPRSASGATSTHRPAWHGSKTFTQAALFYRSAATGAEGMVKDDGRYRHFAATEQSTSGQCVRFYGAISSGGHGGPLAEGARNKWGNCR